jgi:hypothetical protein
MPPPAPISISRGEISVDWIHVHLRLFVVTSDSIRNKRHTDPNEIRDLHPPHFLLIHP